MGSVAIEKDISEEQPINVLITGFAPFKKDYPVNPSWEIARSLPAYLPPLRAKTVNPSPSTTARPIPPVRLLTHPEPIHVAYSTVRALVPQLWHLDESESTSDSSNPELKEKGEEKGEEKWEGEGGKGTNTDPPIPDLNPNPNPPADSNPDSKDEEETPPSHDDDAKHEPLPNPNPEAEEDPTNPKPKIDMALHIGMAGPRLFYAIERRGHRDGYVMRDVDGALPVPVPLPEDGGDGEGGGELGRGKEELVSGFDVEDVLGRWRGFCPKHLDLRISEDAGRYLCDYIYYTSLAHLEKAGRERKVLFLHVPSDPSEHSVTLGRELVLQLVRSMVESEVARRAEAKGVVDSS